MPSPPTPNHAAHDLASLDLRAVARPRRAAGGLRWRRRFRHVGAAPRPAAAIATPAPAGVGPRLVRLRPRCAAHRAGSAIASQDLGRIAWYVRRRPRAAIHAERRAAHALRLAGRDDEQHRRDPGEDGRHRRLSRRRPRRARPARSCGRRPPTTSRRRTTGCRRYNVLLTPQGRLYAPGAGGKLLVRADADAASGTFATHVFYGAAAYNANPAAFDGTRVHQHAAHRRCAGQRLLRLPRDRREPGRAGQRHRARRARRHAASGSAPPRRPATLRSRSPR